MATPNDTTTTLNPGVGGDVMDESLVTQEVDGLTAAKRPRVVLGGDGGELFGDENPMPVDAREVRWALERNQVAAMSMPAGLTVRHREQVVRRGERLNIIEGRGPGGR